MYEETETNQIKLCGLKSNQSSVVRAAATL